MAIDILLGVLAGVFMITAVIGALILHAQKKLDSPYGGILVVEKQDGEPALVYFQAVRDPGTFTDGQELKLKVRVMSQDKH